MYQLRGIALEDHCVAQYMKQLASTSHTSFDRKSVFLVSVSHRLKVDTLVLDVSDRFILHS